MKDVIGFDCDGNPIYEYMIVRTPFYPYIDFSKVNGVDPRQYCVLKGNDSKYYLISVLDWYNKEAIKTQEGIKGNIKVIVKDINESENYEIATDCNENILYYDLNRLKLKKCLEEILMERKLNINKEKTKQMKLIK